MKRILGLIVIAVLLGVVNGALAASNPIWSVVSLNTIGCKSGDIGFTMNLDLNGNPPGIHYFHTIVDAGGKRYMNESFPAPFSGNLNWHLYTSTSGGPTTASFPLPAVTTITVTFDVLDSTDTTVLSHLIYIIPNCTGQKILACASLPDTAVVGKFISDVVLDWAPGKGTEPHDSISQGESAWVLGVDETGKYYKILWSCEYRWVPVESMGPDYDVVWQGRPLPTDVTPYVAPDTATHATNY